MGLCLCAPSHALGERFKDTVPFQKLEPAMASKEFKSKTSEIKKLSKYLVKRGYYMHVIRYLYMKLR